MPNEQKMYPIVLRVVDWRGDVNRVPISAISLIGYGNVRNLPMYPEKRFLKCLECGHHDFIDGIAINHYECDGCNTGYQVWPVDERKDPSGLNEKKRSV